MKISRILFRINAALLIIALGTFLIGLFAYGGVLTDYFTKKFFIKKIVKVEGTDTIGDGFTTRVPYCIVDNERINISTTKELTIDKYYYVWYNSKTKHTYLTNKDSNSFKIFRFETGELMILAALLMTILLYFNLRFFRKRIIDKYGEKSL